MTVIAIGETRGLQAVSKHSVIAENSRITLHFSLSLLDGQLIDSNFFAEPATFCYGDGSLLPSFEAALLGLSAGQKHTVTIAAADAFGVGKSENIQSFKRSAIESAVVQQAPLGESDQPLSLQPGLVLSFSDAAGGELPGVIAAVEGEQVRVDFNHPLAGKDIVFEVQIIAVASVDESAKGSGEVGER